jgi:quinol monooxygenase YgiN
MYGRVTTFQVQPEKMDEANQIANDSIIPAIRQQAGLKSFIALQDRSSGKSMLVSVFETEADAKSGLSGGFVQQQVAKIAPMLAGTPTTEFYEVFIQE